MSKWKVCTMLLGGGMVDLSMMIRYQYNKGEHHARYISLAATDGKAKVVIDTGSRVASKSNNPKFHKTEEEHLEYTLKHHLGWHLDEVDIVINTHLHEDHCGGNYLFKNADFYVQEKEWELAHHLSPSDYDYYDPKDYSKESVNYFKWHFLHGDTQILPGLSVITTPGHTDGCQSVLLNTEEGVLCFAGDAVAVPRNILENLEGGITTNTRSYYNSLEKIKSFSHCIICGHDMDMTSGKKDGFLRIP